MKKLFKVFLYALIIGLVLYNSVSISKLSDLKNAVPDKFDAVAYTQQLWKNRMQGKLDSAVELSTLIKEVEANQQTALDKYGNALGIGNYRYVLVKAMVNVTEIKADELQVQYQFENKQIDAVLATEYIYGNAVRDASGLVTVKDFSNTDDLNGISEAMNDKIRKEVLPSFKKAIQKGQKVKLVAAIELNKAFVKWKGLELIPIQLEILP
jgi:predicted lipoprotein